MACLECRGKRWCLSCGNPEVFQGIAGGAAIPQRAGAAELAKSLRRIRETLGHDPEAAHGAADKALIDFIGDEEVREAFESLITWYA